MISSGRFMLIFPGGLFEESLIVPPLLRSLVLYRGVQFEYLVATVQGGCAVDGQTHS
jgi:hypothetical protein